MRHNDEKYGGWEHQRNTRYLKKKVLDSTLQGWTNETAVLVF